MDEKLGGLWLWYERPVIVRLLYCGKSGYCSVGLKASVKLQRNRNRGGEEEDATRITPREALIWSHLQTLLITHNYAFIELKEKLTSL